MGIIDIALNEIGSTESGQNQIKYNKWYYNRDVVGGSYPYCAVFVSWCAYKAGLPNTIIPKTASVKAMYEFFLQKNCFRKVSKDYLPQPGDLMIQRSNRSSHIGIVINSDPLGFTTIEGNSGVGVEICRHSYAEPELTGFATPEYLPGMIFELSRFANDINDSTAWNYFKGLGYNDTSTAALVGKIKQGNTRYNTGWHDLTTNSAELGIFNWKWTGITITSTSESDIKPEDIAKWTKKFPTATLSKFIRWCDDKGDSSKYQDAEFQVTFFFENSGSSLTPASLNSKTIEQATQIVAEKLGTATSNDLSIVREIYGKFANKTPEQVASTLPDTAEQKDMRAANDIGLSVIHLGMYEWLPGGHTVKEGETLDSIAAQHGTTPQLIIWANNRDTWEVEVGESLRIPIIKKENLAKITADTPLNPIEKRHSTNIEISHPTARVIFYGEYGKLTATTVSSTLISENNADNDIISISTNRSLSNDNPTFSISMVWKNSWYTKLGSNDLVIIYLQRPPEPMAAVMFGLIDDIRKSMDFSSGQPQRSVIVTGRGFSKAFVNFDISVISNYSQNTGGNGFFVNLLNLPGHSSSDNIKLAVEAYLDKGMRYKFSNGKTLRDYLGYDGTNLYNEKLINTQSFTSFNGSLWNFIKQLTNEPFNETFFEIRDNTPYLIHRATPFSPEDWTKLHRITIKDYDLVSDNTGRSDVETYSAFQVDMFVENLSTKNAFPPAFYPPYYEKYGIRMHSVKTLYAITPGSVTEDENLNPTVLTKRLADFEIKNNIMENGTITVKGSNQYKIGERVILETSGIEYYVEEVSQSFNMYSLWTTQLKVTRGLRPEDRFTPPYGACIDLTNDIYDQYLNLQNGKLPDWTKVQAGGTPQNEKGNSGVKGDVKGISAIGEGKGIEDAIVVKLDFDEMTDLDQGSVTTISLHHTSSTTATVEGIHQYHKESNGWSGIGYHFFIKKNGDIYQGRSLKKVGAHTYNHNSYTIGLALEGDLTKEKPTSAQLATLSKVAAELAVAYNIELSSSTLKGHNEFSGNNTDCPGCLMDYRTQIIEKADQIKKNVKITREEPEQEESDTTVTKTTPSNNEFIKSSKTYTYNSLQWVWPAPNCYYISSGFGFRNHPIQGVQKAHQGLDIVSSSGSTSGSNIIAACDGKVIYAGRNGTPSSGYGNLIEILHSNGMSTRYGHMYDNGVLVKVGDTVKAGQVIGKIGSFGGSTGAHLHFEVRTGVGESYSQQGTAINPLDVFAGIKLES